MKKILYILIAGFTFYSCSSVQTVKKKASTVRKVITDKKYSSSKTTKVTGSRATIVKEAQKYIGVPYKYAGNTRSGMDCSGLVTKVFDENNIKLPRQSSQQASQGSAVSVGKVMPGDLLFFATSGGKKVSHVGIVSKVENNGDIKFVHSSTSKGVITSSINETYWKKAFLFARTIL